VTYKKLSRYIEKFDTFFDDTIYVKNVPEKIKMLKT